MSNLSRLDTQRTFEALAVALDAVREAVRELPAPALRTVLADLHAEEVWTSMRLADSPLDRSESDALIRREIALGGHALDAYVRVADYASAARFVRETPSTSRRRGFLTMEELVTLHALATRRTSDRPGRLRETTLPQFPSGMVASPAWLIPQSLAAFVERVHAGPPADTHPLLWIADAHARYERIHPFSEANGRVGRLLIDVLLKRCGYVPFVYRARSATAWIAARRAADSRNGLPLAIVLARSLVRSYAFLGAAQPDREAARPLAEFANGARLAALYKAAQRNRLRAFRRDGRLLTTAAWIADYEDCATRAPASAADPIPAARSTASTRL